MTTDKQRAGSALASLALALALSACAGESQQQAEPDNTLSLSGTCDGIGVLQGRFGDEMMAYMAGERTLAELREAEAALSERWGALAAESAPELQEALSVVAEESKAGDFENNRAAGQALGTAVEACEAAGYPIQVKATRGG